MHALLRRADSNSRRGSALVAALGVVTLIAVMSVAYLHAALSRSSEGVVAADAKRAFYIAEAGLSEAYQGLRTGRSGNVGSDVTPARFGNGVFWVVAEHLGSGRLALKSTGLCGRGRASLAIVVENTGDSVAALGFHGAGALTVRAGAFVDSYDSTLGAYEEQESGAQASVGSDGEIAVQGTRVAPTTIRGDVVPGPASAVVRTGNTTITGSTAPRDAPEELPEIALPDVATSGSHTHGSKSRPMVVDGGEHGWDVLRVKPECTLSILGPATVVARRLVVDSGGSLAIDSSGGPVRLYVEDQLHLAAGSTVETPDTFPAGVTILVPAAEGVDHDGDRTPDPAVTLGASGKLHGSIYAPNADVTLPGSLEVFGALTARSVVLGEGARLHFDRSLSAAAGSGTPAALCWRIVELPPVPLVRQRRDPLTALKLAGITPIDACDAHYAIGTVPPSNDPNVTPFAGGLAGSGALDASAADTAEVLTPADMAIVAVIDQVPALASSALATELLATTPLKDGVLKKTLQRKEPMSGTDLAAVLRANAPLSKGVLMELLKHSAKLSSADLKDVLVASSPLPSSTLDELQKRAPLTPADMSAVLSAQ